VDININGFSIKIEPVYDMDGWLAYIAKDQEGHILKRYTSTVGLFTEQTIATGRPESASEDQARFEDVTLEEPTFLDSETIQKQDSIIMGRIKRKLF